MNRSRRLVLLVAAGLSAASLAACGGGDPKDAGAELKPAATTTAPVSDVKVGLAYVNTAGDTTTSPAAISAIEQATADFGITSKAIGAEKLEDDKAKEDRLRQLAEDGYNPVIVTGRSYSYPLNQVAPEYPKTQFAIIDGPVAEAKNVTQLLFDEHEGTFLAGAIAGEASSTQKVGFIGGTASPGFDAYSEGFSQGVKASAPKAKVAVEYVAEDPSGFQDPGRSRALATQMIEHGNDVLFTVSYDSDPGVFEAAAKDDALAIGLQNDQYALASAKVQPAILTSVVFDAKPVAYAMIRSAVDGDMLTGTKRFGVKSGAITLATSNPAMKPYEAAAKEYADQLASGAIKVS